MRVLLDTNATSHLVQWTKADPTPIRNVLLGAVKRGILRVEGSLEVFSEIAGVIRGDRNLFESVTELLFALVGRYWVLPLSERHDTEMAYRGPLPDGTLYMPRRLRRDLRRFGANEPQVRAVAAEIGGQADQYKREAESARDSVIGRLKIEARGDPPKEVTQSDIRLGMRQWLAEVDIDDWCRDVLDDGVRQGRIQADRDRWPDVRLVAPSLWHYMNYRLARIAFEVGEGRRIQPSDEYDARHYSFAATYADLLVTEDVAFRRTCETLGDSDLRVVSLLDLMALLEESSDPAD